MMRSCRPASGALLLFFLPALNFQRLRLKVRYLDRRRLCVYKASRPPPDRLPLLKPLLGIHLQPSPFPARYISSTSLCCDSDRGLPPHPTAATSCGNSPARLTQVPLCLSFFISCSTVKNTSFTWCLQCYPPPPTRPTHPHFVAKWQSLFSLKGSPEAFFFISTAVMMSSSSLVTRANIYGERKSNRSYRNPPFLIES